MTECIGMGWWWEWGGDADGVVVCLFGCGETGKRVKSRNTDSGKHSRNTQETQIAMGKTLTKHSINRNLPLGTTQKTLIVIDLNDERTS